MIHVYHKIEFGQPAQWPDGYMFAAHVATDDKEEAFRLTNHIGPNWTANTRVWASSTRHRSTSVGDMMVDADEKVWKVSFSGFTQFERPSQPPIVADSDL